MFEQRNPVLLYKICLDGEMPTVVVLKDGDLSKEEADRIMLQNKKGECMFYPINK